MANTENPAATGIADRVRNFQANQAERSEHKEPARNSQALLSKSLIGASLTWKRAGKGWRLFDGRRRFGDAVPDSKHPGMWRIVLPGGRLSDMANLSWARSAVMDAAVRELQFEARQVAATDPLKCPVNGGGFQDGSSPVRSTASDPIPSPQNKERDVRSAQEP